VNHYLQKRDLAILKKVQAMKMNKENDCVIGVDFGTDSVRAILVNAADGTEYSSAVFQYPRWKQKLYCSQRAHQFRQHPLDYTEGLEYVVKTCVKLAGPEIAANVCALSVDTTGSTPIAVDQSGTPLSLLSEFATNPNAMFVLWKDHTAVVETAEINEHAKTFDINYLQYVGGIYSSEWFWAKLLNLLRKDSEVANKISSFVEHCDWIPFLLTGGKDVAKMKRSICAAGHKALWSEEWGGLPPASFFETLDPLLKNIASAMFRETQTAAESAGTISKEWAEKLGLPEDTLIGVGAFDAHMGAVGGQIEPYYLSKVMGTSTCDILVIPQEEMGDILVKGICGQVTGSVLPRMVGLEAGQSAFGDAYAWFRMLLMEPVEALLEKSNLLSPSQISLLKEQLNNSLISWLSDRAAALPVTLQAELATDWFNGRRTPDANQLLKATITGVDLGTDAVHFFRSIVEATCFGAKAIVMRFKQQGLPIKGLIGLGGVARKSPFIMQMMADVLNMPIRIHKSEQTCALGAAMFAATVAGIYPRVQEAMAAMGPGFDQEYLPDRSRESIYNSRYEKYLELGNLSDKIFTKSSKDQNFLKKATASGEEIV